MATDWEIKSRAHRCSATERQFEDGETFYTLLFREEEGFERLDLCVDAWKERDKARTPFSSWKSKYEVPPPPPPEALGKQTAEALLRHFMRESGDQHANVRYILALMLERKRQLKPIETKEEGGRILLIYEHRQSGEVFVIPDPQLRLDQIEPVQEEVAGLLAGAAPFAIEAEESDEENAAAPEEVPAETAEEPHGEEAEEEAEADEVAEELKK